MKWSVPIDLFFLIYPNFIVFAFAQYSSINQNSFFALFNYIISCLSSIIVIIAVPICGYALYKKNSPWINHLTIGCCQSNIAARYRMAFILMRRLAFGVALGLYP